MGAVIARLPLERLVPAMASDRLATLRLVTRTRAVGLAGRRAADLYVKPGWAIILTETGVPSGVPVLEVLHHPDADVALLRLATGDLMFEPFWNSVRIHGLGEDVMAYGYPENVRSDEREPTARLSKGYVQRVFLHESHIGYSYSALEMDFACPGGLSGGPLFRPAAPQMVVGLVTENFESTTRLDAVEEITQGGETKRIQYQEVVGYGLTVSLDTVDDWLNENLAVFDHTAYMAREAKRRSSAPADRRRL